MRTAVSVILVFLTIPLVLIGLLVASLKFQLLEPKFWETAFEKNNVYTQITDVVKRSLVDQTVKEGGRASDIGSITDLVTTVNVRDFVNRNLENLLTYANGKARELLVYIPVGRAPKGFLPKNFENLPETLPLTSLLTKLNIMGIAPAQIQYISLTGRVSGYILVLDAAVLALFLLLLFVLTGKGSRFIAPAVALILNGLAIISLYYYAGQLQAQTLEVVTFKPNTGQIVLGIVMPPVLHEILQVWLIAGLVLLVIGVLLFFIRKPSYTK